MKLSIVIPTYRSEANLPLLLEKLKQVLQSLVADYEIIIVDDNSPDNTLTFLRKAAADNNRVKVISLARNFGQQIAISAGLKYATGDAVIVMDDDLQDPPEFIPNLVNKWKEGYDIVYAIRTNRKEGFIKRLGYRLFYWLISLFAEVNVPPDSGDFSIMSKRIVTVLNNMNESGRFLRGLRAWVGYKQIGIACERGKRHKGPTSYSFPKLIKLSADGIFSMSNKPLRLVSWPGAALVVCGAIGLLYDVLRFAAGFAQHQGQFSRWPRLNPVILAVLLLGGAQLVGMGIVGEYIGRIYDDVKQRPSFLIKEAIGIETGEKP